MFEIKNTLSFNKDVLVDGDEYDYVTRTSQNQGILQETGFVNNENINPSGNWSLGLLQMDFFYRHKPWYAGQFVRKVIPKIELTPNSILYFTVLFNKQKQSLLSVLVRDVDETFNNTTIQLPVTPNGSIDFAFMENFIAELEAERIAELEAYLRTTGLTDYILTDEEKTILKAFRNGTKVAREVVEVESVDYQLFKIGDLFEKLNLRFLKPTFDKENDISKEKSLEFDLPLVNAKNGDNGVMYYGRSKDFESAEMTIDIVNDGAVSTGNVYSQPQKTGVLYNAYLVKPSFTTNEKLLHFCTATIQKSIKYKFGYENKAGWEKVKQENISLPVRNGKPDHAAMETLISAVQKLVIKDVVQYADRKIKATKTMAKL